MTDDPARLNRAYWNREADAYQGLHGDRLSEAAMAWGVWRIPEAEVSALGEISGGRVLDLGCGAAQWSVALAGAGARPIGMDLSEEQLRHAASRVREAGARVPLVQADATHLPFADASFDAVVSDGAMSFADPAVAIPEVARVLRRGGRFSFCIATPWLFACWDPDRDRLDRRLHADYFGPARRDAEGFVEYQLPYGEWIDLFRSSGLEVERLVELRPPGDATTTYRDYVPLAWARRWPAEMVWVLRRA